MLVLIHCWVIWKLSHTCQRGAHNFSRMRNALFSSVVIFAKDSCYLCCLRADQELRILRSTMGSCWKGTVAVTGTKQGRPVKGRGYVELTGYAEKIKM